MAFRLSRVREWLGSTPRSTLAAEKPSVRPMLESLEERTVPSATPGLPLNVAGVQNLGGQLTALVQVGANSIPTPITLTATPGSDPSTQILNLHLNPISLNLLGLGLQTSSICLDITAHQGGGLLGNVLFNVAHALDNGQSVSSVLSGLNPLQNLVLSFELTAALDSAFNALNGPSATTASTAPPGATDILDLSVGPLDLHLLGLQIDLNNCATPPGPVTVDLFAQPGPGNLLGNLLSGLGGLTSTLGPARTEQLLTQVADTILMTV